MRNIYFAGFMASGKTTISKQVAKKLSRPFYDLDEEVEKRSGMTIPEIFEKIGEDGFREYEKNTLKEIIAERPRNSIISLGGGTVIRKETVEIIKKNGMILVLEADIDTIYSRLRRSSTNRPLLNNSKDLMGTIKELMGQRKNIYRSVANMVINTSGKSALEVTLECIYKIKSYK